MTRDEEWLLNEKYLGERTDEFFADCERLKTGEPLAYVIGHTPFLDTTISLLSRPLIPRTETEYWVKEIIDTIDVTRNVRVLDLCAGSGCIGVAVLSVLPHSKVDFAEIDEKHHATIQKNIEQNDIDTSRTRIYGGDLFEKVEGPYDYILSNPPYIDPTLNRTEASVLEHEPHQALFAPDEGFAIIEKIIREAPVFLSPKGTLVLEHEPEQTVRIHKLANESGWSVTTKLDQYGIERYTVLIRRCIETMAP